MLENHHLKQTLLTYLETYQTEHLAKLKQQPLNLERYLQMTMEEIETAIQDRMNSLMDQGGITLAQALMQAEREILNEKLPVPTNPNEPELGS